MILKSKQSKNMPYTDNEINRYCESVEKLLIKIKEDSLAKKRKKVREVVVEEKHIEEYINEEEDDFVLS